MHTTTAENSLRVAVPSPAEENKQGGRERVDVPSLPFFLVGGYGYT